MKPGTALRIPDAVASRVGGRVEAIQPGLPGKWSVWSQSDESPGAHFVIPLDEAARATGVKHATIRVVHPQGEDVRIQLLRTEPSSAMPPRRTGG